MRKILVSTFISLDGVMQAPGGPEEDPVGGFEHGGWVWPHFDDEGGAAMGEILGGSYDLLLGRKTYDIFAAHWPYADPNDPIAKSFNAATKYVASRSKRPLAWQNSRYLGADAVAALNALKQENGPTLLVQGSSDFMQTLWRAGLVDEFYVLIFPLVLGKGKRLFGDGVVPAALKLMSSRTTPSGVIIAKYLPEGPVKTGSFQHAEPSAAEVERRKNLT